MNSILPPLICKVCNEEFKDSWAHLSNNKEGWFEIKDKAHADYYDEIEKGGMDEMGTYNMPCFCGGRIQMTGSSDSDGGASWETVCVECGFLFDED